MAQIMVNVGGQLKTLNELAVEAGLSAKTIYRRYRRGDPPEKLAEPRRTPIKVEVNGEMVSIRRAERLTGLSEGAIRKRLTLGQDVNAPKWARWGHDRKDPNAYTTEELYKLFTGFAGNVSDEEEARMLADFMAKSAVDKEVEKTLAEFRRRRYMELGR